MLDLQKDELQDKYANMTDRELIQEHTYSWKHWKRYIAKFGYMTAHVAGEGLHLMEEEARKRGIVDDVLMAPIKEWEELCKVMPTPDSINALLRAFANRYGFYPNLMRMNKKTHLYLLMEFPDCFDMRFDLQMPPQRYQIFGISGEVEYQNISDGEVRISLEVSSKDGK